MSRRKTEINPIRAERVKILIDREKLTQAEFANRIFQTQQNVSRIIQKRQPLTEENAQQIVKIFPKYRIEWLLGYDDNMTFEDLADSWQFRKDKTADGFWVIFDNALQKQGKSLRFVHRQNDPVYGSHINSTERLKADCYYSIVDKDGNEVKRLTPKQMIEIEMKAQEYCEFLATKYL